MRAERLRDVASLIRAVAEVRARPQPAHLRTPSVDDADGPASKHVERALEHDDRGAFIETDANQLVASIRSPPCAN
jgi:hypothetical protein